MPNLLYLDWTFRSKQMHGIFSQNLHKSNNDMLLKYTVFREKHPLSLFTNIYKCDVIMTSSAAMNI